MSITGKNISDKAKILLLDEAGIRYLDAEMLHWVNLAQKEIVVLKPNALVKNLSVALAAGSKQTLPAGGLVVIDVIRNMGAAGTTPGKAIFIFDKETLDAICPDWHGNVQAKIISYYLEDPRDPKTFYVYPPSDGTTQVELVYAATPTALTALTDTMQLDDVYEGALLDYVLYRAYAKDAENPANMNRSTSHYQAFVSALGGKIQGEAATTAKAKR